MKNPITPEQLIEQLEKPLNPAQQFVKLVNEIEPNTFPYPSDEDMQRDHVQGDVDTFDNSENI